MEFRDIQSLILVVENQSFTKAAEKSHLSQPSLSKAVKRLEEELEVELIDRSSRYLCLTDAGKIVYEQGVKAINIINNIPTSLNELKDLVTGQIRIGIPPLIGTLFFPEIAKAFHKLYPNVKLDLVEVGAKVVERLVESEEVDVGLVVLPVDEGKFNIYPYIIDDFLLYVHHEHRLSHKKAIAIKSLEKERFILFPKHFTIHSYIINACKDAGFTPTVSYESSQWDLILELVGSNMGVALMPKCIFQKQSNPNICVIRLEEPSLIWRLGIITKKGSYHSFALQKFLDMIVNPLN